MFYFTRTIYYLHTKLIMKFGGREGIKEEVMLDSALSTPLQTFDSSDLYPSTIEKITRLSFEIVMNHPFIDGNKRIAAKVLDVGLFANNIILQVTNDGMIEEFLSLASGNTKYQEFLNWTKSHINLIHQEG